MMPPQDRDYDEFERLAMTVGEVGAVVAEAFIAFSDRLAELGALISDAYYDRLAKSDDEPIPGSTSGNTGTGTPDSPPD